jgi:hypothetical protein
VAHTLRRPVAMPIRTHLQSFSRVLHLHTIGIVYIVQRSYAPILEGSLSVRSYPAPALPMSHA